MAGIFKCHSLQLYMSEPACGECVDNWEWISLVQSELGNVTETEEARFQSLFSESCHPNSAHGVKFRSAPEVLESVSLPGVLSVACSYVGQATVDCRGCVLRRPVSRLDAGLVNVG